MHTSAPPILRLWMDEPARDLLWVSNCDNRVFKDTGLQDTHSKGEGKHQNPSSLGSFWGNSKQPTIPGVEEEGGKECPLF